MTETKELEINEMQTESSLPAKMEELMEMDPLQTEVLNQRTGEFEKVMISPQDIRKFLCPSATYQELYIFMSVCRHQGIDPVTEAYFVKYENLPGFTVVKYTVYLKRAMLSGKLKSIRHEFDDEDDPSKITVYIERTDIPGEWAMTTYMKDVQQRRKKDDKVTAIWAKEPRFMLQKTGYKRGLTFFCADLVGAEPPSLGEGPMNSIAALNMPMSPERIPFEDEGKEIAEEAEVLEVNEVKDVPEEMDLRPLQSNFHGMIAGMFPTEDARHKWQLEKVGVESQKNWGIPEWAKAFKALSMEAGPPNVHNGSDTESSDTPQEQPTSADGTEVGDGVENAVEEDTEQNQYLQACKEKYLEKVGGKFESREAQATWEVLKLGKTRDFWIAPDYLNATVLLDKVDKPDLHSPLEELREEYNTAAHLMFDTEEEKVRWEVDLIGLVLPDDWDPDQFRTAILEMKDYNQLDPQARQFAAIKLEYHERIEGKFETMDEQMKWQADASQKSGDIEDWGIPHFRLALIALDEEAMAKAAADQEPPKLEVGQEIDISVERDKPPVLRGKIVAIDENDITIETNDKRHCYEPDAVMKFIDAGMWKIVSSDNAEGSPELMTQPQFKELKEIVGQLPQYHNNLGSKQFRDRAKFFTGRRPRSIRKYSEREASDLIQQFTDELEDYKRELEDPKKEPGFD